MTINIKILNCVQSYDGDKCETSEESCSGALLSSGRYTKKSLMAGLVKQKEVRKADR